MRSGAIDFGGSREQDLGLCCGIGFRLASCVGWLEFAISLKEEALWVRKSGLVCGSSGRLKIQN